MRKTLLTLLAIAATLAAIPAASLADGGDHHRGDRHREPEHQREHRHARDRDRIQHQRVGGQDGIGHDAGTVASFTDGQLTIRLNDGSSVTGAVTRLSELECQMPELMRPSDQGPGASGSGSRGGSGDDNGQDGPDHDPGDDHGQDGPNHDPGDDNGQDGPNHDPGDDNGQPRCGMVAPGTVVRDATLTLTGFGAVWTRVDLINS